MPLYSPKDSSLLSFALFCFSFNFYQTYIAVLLLLLLSHFSRVQPCATPETAARQASPSLGFSRQEHWSGLPFPSAVHERERERESESVQSCLTLSDPWTAAYQAPPSLGFSRQEYLSGVPLPSPSYIARKSNSHGLKAQEKDKVL